MPGREPGEPRERTGRRGGPVAKVTGIALCAAVLLAVATPAAHGAARLAVRLAAAIHPLPKKARPAVPAVRAGTPFGGTPAVGALFTTTGHGSLGSHFCTASVVHSPNQDLAVTAAHCVAGLRGVIAFVPGWGKGSAPYGIWTVSRVIVDQAWTSSASIDDDVAFLVIKQVNGLGIEDVTGAEQLAIGELGRLPVQVIGYPDGQDQPLTCTGRTSVPLPRQLEFDCGSYTLGTSGGPFLMNVSRATGTGTVIGVIGGYEQGGDLPQVSYAAEFGPNVARLYAAAVKAG